MTKVNDVVRDLTDLVAFPTVSNRPVVGLASFLGDRLEDLGFAVQMYTSPTDAQKANVVASIGPSGTDGLVLSGHMDVVPTEGQPWTTDPFRVTPRDGRLFGRGTADMKGFLAATLQALGRIRQREYRKELVLVWTHDEEVGCLGSQVLAGQLAAEGRLLPSQCLIGEPTDFRVLRMHPGHVGLSVEISGRAAHSSRPDLGHNAIEDAVKVIGAIQGVARELENETVDLSEMDRPWVPVNVATIEGGSAINIVPDSVRIEVGYRPVPGMKATAVFERIEAAVAGVLPRRNGRVELIRVTPSMCTSADEPLVGLLRQHARDPRLGSASFATDGGNLSKVGCAPLVFGPGSIEVAHKADEYVPVDQLHQAVDIVEAVVRARCC
jgi:acetylornithine deacetylase